MASSTAASSASDSVGASVGSVSDSFKNSSDSSSKDKRVAEGDYTVIAVIAVVESAALPERPARVRLKLQALAEGGDDPEFILPQRAVDQSGLAPGHTVTVRRRPYGLELSGGPTRLAFFLLLDDDWYRELASVAVVN